MPLTYELLPMVAQSAAVCSRDILGSVRDHRHREDTIKVANRSLLEQRACKCHRVIAGFVAPAPDIGRSAKCVNCEIR
jgi:hypothetical protein